MANLGLGGFGSATDLGGFNIPTVGSGRPNANMTMSPEGLTALKFSEAIRGQPNLKSYKDTQGVWTIGFGHTGRDVTPGMTISRAEAEDLFKKDVALHERAVRDHVTVPLSQHQFDALAHFTYNIGPQGFKNSRTLSFLNEGKYDLAGKAMLGWLKNPELTGRRNAEVALFERGVYPHSRSQTQLASLREGQRGQAVAELQSALAAMGYEPGPIDGQFGSQTKAAVQALQSALGVEPDGIFGPATSAALGALPSPAFGPAAPMQTVFGQPQLPTSRFGRQASLAQSQTPGGLPAAPLASSFRSQFAEPPAASAPLAAITSNFGPMSLTGRAERSSAPNEMQAQGGLVPPTMSLDPVSAIAGMAGAPPASAAAFGPPGISLQSVQSAPQGMGAPAPASAFDPPGISLSAAPQGSQPSPESAIDALAFGLPGMDALTGWAERAAAPNEAMATRGLAAPAMGLSGRVETGRAPEAFGDLSGFPIDPAFAAAPSPIQGVQTFGPTASIAEAARSLSAPDMDLRGVAMGRAGLGTEAAPASTFTAPDIGLQSVATRMGGRESAPATLSLSPATGIQGWAEAASRSADPVADLSAFSLSPLDPASRAGFTTTHAQSAGRHGMPSTMDQALGIPTAQTLAGMGMQQPSAAPPAGIPSVDFGRTAQARTETPEFGLSPFSGLAEPAELSPDIDFTSLPGPLATLNTATPIGRAGTFGVPTVDFQSGKEPAAPAPSFDPVPGFNPLGPTPIEMRGDLMGQMAATPADLAFGVPSLAPASQPAPLSLPSPVSAPPEPIALPTVAAPQQAVPTVQPPQARQTQAPLPGRIDDVIAAQTAMQPNFQAPSSAAFGQQGTPLGAAIDAGFQAASARGTPGGWHTGAFLDSMRGMIDEASPQFAAMEHAAITRGPAAVSALGFFGNPTVGLGFGPGVASGTGGAAGGGGLAGGFGAGAGLGFGPAASVSQAAGFPSQGNIGSDPQSAFGFALSFGRSGRAGGPAGGLDSDRGL